MEPLQRKGKQYTLAAGDGFVVVPERIVSYAADRNDPWEYCWVGFNGADAKRLMEQTGLLGLRTRFSLRRQEDWKNCLRISAT